MNDNASNHSRASSRNSFGYANHPSPFSPSSPFRRRSSISRRRLPPIRRRFEQPTSIHMLPTSAQSRNQNVFSSKYRLVARDLPFFQSKNKLRVKNQHSHLRLWKLLQNDWFHVMLRLPMSFSLTLLLTVWTLVIVIFAGVYMRIDYNNKDMDCGLGAPGQPIQFAPAFAFSLETCTTVGYGLPSGTNAFFEDQCNDVQVAIYFQMVWSMMFNAFLFAFFFAQVAVCESRGIQVIFSNKAIIGNRPDIPYPCFFFRVFDADAKHPVVEAHVRIYVITQKSPIPMPLRIVIPNDDLGGMLYLSLPCQVVHAMDNYSPLVPRPDKASPVSATLPNHGLQLRQVDSDTNNRDDVNCPVCGESYGTAARLIKHGKYQKMMESHDKVPYKGSHQEVDWDEWAGLLEESTTWSISQLESFFRRQISEILCVVEGIDPLASGTFQALHSYQIQDIHFGNAHFADCVCLDQHRACVVDMDYFHRINTEHPAASALMEVDAIREELKAKQMLSSESAKENEQNREEATGKETTALGETKQPNYQSASPPVTPQRSRPGQDDPKDDLPPVAATNHAQKEQQSTASLTSDTSNIEPNESMYGPMQTKLASPDENSRKLPPLPPPPPPHETIALKPAAEASPSFTRTVYVASPGAQSQSGRSTGTTHTDTPVMPHHEPRLYSAPVNDTKQPPPLFVIDQDLMGGTSDTSHSYEPTGRAPRKSSLPGSMMNSLATGKFDD